MQMMQKINICVNESNTLYKSVTCNTELIGMLIFAPKTHDFYTFRGEFIRPENCVHQIHGLNVSIPIDAPGQIKTELLGKIPIDADGKPNIFKAPFIYDNNCGYDNFWRVNSEAELIDEIIRISVYLSTPVVIEEEI